MRASSGTLLACRRQRRYDGGVEGIAYLFASSAMKRKRRTTFARVYTLSRSITSRTLRA